LNIVADPEALRKARGCMTRPEAARKIKISTHHLRDIERGRRQPGFQVAIRLATVYKTPLEALVKVSGG